MTPTANFAALLTRYFTQRLIQQRSASPHTIKSYRDTFHLLLLFAKTSLGKEPSQLTIEQIDAPLVSSFLDDLENRRGIGTRSRNLRLTAIRSFFRFAAFELPAQSEPIQRVLAIPCKRCVHKQIHYLTRPEVDALLAAPDQTTWSGRRDHAGSVAKFGRWPLVICEREAPYLSGSHFEQYRNEFRLGLDVVSTDVPNLPFPDHCHRLVTRQRSSSRPEVAKAKPWTG